MFASSTSSSSPSSMIMSLLSLLPLLAFVSATPFDAASPRFAARQAGSTLATNGTAGARPLGFQNVGDSGISAQMMWLGNKKKVYILDKVENNPVQINGRYGTHPAWAVEYDIATNTYRTMDVESNTFCAAGAELGNGTWAVFGGNQPVTTNGVATTELAAYKNTAGGTAIRLLTPCEDNSCSYIQGNQPLNQNNGDTGGYLQMTGRRWYPTVEALEDGSLIIIGGDKNGGYVNTAVQDNPTYEFFPPKGDGKAINLQFLTDTLPINLYALTWLLPSGKLFMQANRQTILYDYKTKSTTDLPEMPHAARVYPASAATIMLPLTPDNGYTPTLLFCGGSATEEWGNDGTAGYNVTAVQADNTCVRISPDGNNPQYEDDDYLFEGRSMGQFVFLPDGTLWMGNGVNMGTAGYGDDHYSIGQSYGQDPVYMPAIYNGSAPKGARWNRTGLTASPNERMYHSTAILLPDSSIMIAGSNPNKDFTTEQWRSRTDVERWYPYYYNYPRPTYSGLPGNISYGGASFDLTINGMLDEASAKTAKVVLIRGGFNTHAIGFGQKYLQLQSTYEVNMRTNVTTLHVSQLPGNPGPTLFQPGSAMFFVLINGVPSEGEFVMVGNGRIGTQPTTSNPALPSSTLIAVETPVTSSVSAGNAGASGTTVTAKSSAGRLATTSAGAVIVALGVVVGGLVM